MILFPCVYYTPFHNPLDIIRVISRERILLLFSRRGVKMLDRRDKHEQGHAPAITACDDFTIDLLECAIIF